MAIRTVKTRFAFNGLPKDLTFTYDTETDCHIEPLVLAGYLADVTPEDVIVTQAPRILISPVGIDSTEKIGDVGGQGSDQPPEGGGGGLAAIQAGGEQDVQGDQGAGAKVAKGRKSRTDVSTDG